MLQIMQLEGKTKKYVIQNTITGNILTDKDGIIAFHTTYAAGKYIKRLNKQMLKHVRKLMKS